MKYRLKKDLPFMNAGTIFVPSSKLCCGGPGCWAIPAKPKAPGQIGDNPVITFASHEDELLSALEAREDWVEVIPDTLEDWVHFYDVGRLLRREFMERLLLKEEI